jgi:catechol 2,3-dioxygenase-like lactoylglutathione lyase family enzyme
MTTTPEAGTGPRHISFDGPHPAGAVTRALEADIRVPDPEATVGFLCGVLDFVDLGLDGGRRQVGLAADYGRPGLTRVLSISEGERPLLRGMTYELAGGAEEALAAHLRQLGTEVAEVDGGFRFDDPNGLPVTCRHATTLSMEPAPPSTIRPRRFGHVTMKVPDGDATAAWYCRHLGFRTSEVVEERMRFLRLGEEHHRLAVGGGGAGCDAQHFAFEVPGWDYYRVLLDHLADRGHTIEYGPGRHAPGRNLFVYLRDPHSPLRLELYCDMATIDNDAAYQVKVWRGEERSRTVNRWGPPPPPSFRED